MDVVEYERRLNELRVALGISSRSLTISSAGRPAAAEAAAAASSVGPAVSVRASGLTETLDMQPSTVKQVALLEVTPMVHELQIDATSSAPSDKVTERLYKIQSFMKTPVVLGIVTFLVVFGLLLMSKVGIFGSDVVDGSGKSARKTNVTSCLGAATAAGSLVLIVPYVVRWRMSAHG